jgi:hypothetical protein
MGFRYGIAGLLVIAVCGTAAAGAGARSSANVRLEVGDAVDVLHTKIACYAIKSNGKIGMTCVLLKGSKFLKGSYGVGLAEDGTAVVTKVKPDGSLKRIFKRRLQARTGHVYRVRVGDAFGLQLTSKVALGCHVLRITTKSLPAIYRGLKVSCWRATATKPLAKTYGVSISDKFAGVFRFDAKGRVTPWGWVRKQPR